MAQQTPPLSRILVVPLRYIGDTILCVPLIRNLRQLYPQARIDVLCSKTSAPLLAECPYIDEIVIEQKGVLKQIQQLKAGQYDAAFILRKSMTTALASMLAGIPLRVGYDKQRFPFGYKRWGLFLTHQARYPSLRTTTPQAVSHLQLLRVLELPVQDDYLELWHNHEDLLAITRLLEAHQIDIQGDKLAALHLASASHGKQIELSKFIPSVRWLAENHYKLIATGTEADHSIYEQLQTLSGLPIVNLAGKTTLRETLALYKKIEVLLTLDSSPIHIGAAASVPKIIGVFGPTNEQQWGAHSKQSQFKAVFMDLPCRPCYAKVCAHNNCKVLLKGEQILHAVQELTQSV